MIDLLDYGFNNIKSEVLKKKDEVITSINISHGDKKFLNVGLNKDLVAYMDIDKDDKFQYKYDYNDIYLPIKSGDFIGKLNVYYDNILINTGELIALDDVNKVTFMQLCKETILT